MLDPSVVTLLSSDVLKLVFKEVFRNRSVLFKDLLRSVGETSEIQGGVDEVKLKSAVKTLKDADLIKEQTAPIDDFNTYYITAHGLSAERQLHLAETSSQSRW